MVSCASRVACGMLYGSALRRSVSLEGFRTTVHSQLATSLVFAAGLTSYGAVSALECLGEGTDSASTSCAKEGGNWSSSRSRSHFVTLVFVKLYEVVQVIIAKVEECRWLLALKALEKW
jgi:hypothetical protein